MCLRYLSGGSKVTLNVTTNNRKQLVVKQYILHEVPSIEETRIKYPHKKIYSLLCMPPNL